MVVFYQGTCPCLFPTLTPDSPSTDIFYQGTCASLSVRKIRTREAIHSSPKSGSSRRSALPCWFWSPQQRLGNTSAGTSCVTWTAPVTPPASCTASEKLSSVMTQISPLQHGKAQVCSSEQYGRKSLLIWFIVVDIELHDKTEDRDSNSEDRITWQNRRQRFKKWR